MLSFLIWFPILVALLLFALPIKDGRLARWTALFPMLAVLAGAAHVYYYTPQNAGYGYQTQVEWLPSLGISYHLGVDRLNGLLVLLTSLVGVAAIAVSRIEENARHFYALTLIIIGGMIGAFASLDLFFLFSFHEFALIPTFILIGIWGSKNRRAAAMKITLYLGLGSLVLLLGLLGVYVKAGATTFDLVQLKGILAAHPLSYQAQFWLFGVLFLGFGILVSVFPFHTWAPIGYGEAPSAAAMLHAGVIKKFGLYGLLAIAAPLLPSGFEAWKPTIVYLALGNLLFCGYVALQQKNLQYMLAYASISHMGYALLALAAYTPLSIQGLTFFLFAHGLGAATAFGVAGFCREQVGTCDFSKLGGLAKKMPFAATVFSMAAFAGCGLPGFANFPAELLIFFGSFSAYKWPTILAIWTTVISAVYFLRAIRTAFLGPLETSSTDIKDVDWERRMAFVLLLGTLLFAGFFPHTILGQTSPHPTALVNLK